MLELGNTVTDKTLTMATELLVNARNKESPDRVRCTISLDV